MKTVKCCLAVLLLNISVMAQNIKVMTYNLRVEVRSDTVNGWDNRKEALTTLVRFYGPDIMGTQEGLDNQLSYISDGIEGFEFVGHGRTDGGSAGEYSAIFYKSTKFDIIMDSTFWLSQTPEKPSRGWDAAYDRVCTYALLKDKETGNSFWVFNTHLDNKGTEARLNGSRLITECIDAVIQDNPYPVILTGDMNCEENDDPIKHFTGKLNDSRKISLKEPYGPAGTFNGFEFWSPLAQRIDYILVSKNNVEITNYYSIDDRYANNKWPSDHLPVMVELNLRY